MQDTYFLPLDTPAVYAPCSSQIYPFNDGQQVDQGSLLTATTQAFFDAGLCLGLSAPPSFEGIDALQTYPYPNAQGPPTPSLQPESTHMQIVYDDPFAFLPDTPAYGVEVIGDASLASSDPQLDLSSFYTDMFNQYFRYSVPSFEM